MTQSLTMTCFSPTVRSAAPIIWDRIWSKPVNVHRDDALIERERSSHRWKLVQRRLNDLFGTVRGVRTIELGSGRGDLSVLLAEGGAEVTLLDACETALHQAKERFARRGLRADFVVGDLTKISGQLGQFDVALSSGVAEHFVGPSRRGVLQKHFDVLREGGVAIVSVPHAMCIPYRIWKLYLELRKCWPYGLEAPFFREEIARMAQEVRFEDVSVHGVGFLQSMCDHILKGLIGVRRDWDTLPSRLDARMGMSLVMFGQRPRSAPQRTKQGMVFHHFWNRANGLEHKMERNWVCTHLPRRAERILDIGCGGGALMRTMGIKRCMGVDLNVAGLEALKCEVRPLRVTASDATCLPFATASFDAITTQHVIEHIPNAAAAVHEWFRALRPEGLLLIVTPNAAFQDPRVFDDPTHVHLFSGPELAQVLAGAGFELVDVRTIGLHSFRDHHGIPGGWRARQWIIRNARALSTIPGCKYSGQSLVCVARKPKQSS